MSDVLSCFCFTSHFKAKLYIAEHIFSNKKNFVLSTEDNDSVYYKMKFTIPRGIAQRL